MAEVAVILAVTKISVALGNAAIEVIAKPWLQEEASLWTELPTRMSHIKAELLVMDGFLTQMGIAKNNNQALEAWIEQVRTLAYRVEDVMDECIYLMNAQQRSSGIVDWLRKLVKGTKNLGVWRRITLELKDIENSFNHLSLMKDRWVQLTGGDASSSNHASGLEVYRGNIEKDENIVEEEKRTKLIELLTDRDEDLSIISVWGMGGLGKSTLVNTVYKSEDIGFPCRAWITVSQDDKPDDLSRKMAEALFPESPQGLDRRNKINRLIKKQLANKKCLIVLDNVWDTSSLYHIKDLLGENRHGSRIVITTRLGAVASLAPESRRINVDGLKEDQAWNVFCKWAFGKNQRSICPPELETSARKIVSKCDGWPLALISIARLLSLRRQKKSEWEKFCDRLGWELNNEKELEQMKHVLYSSFSQLPKYLKNCFLYCCLFPNNQRLSTHRLIRLWVAEGFVEARGTSTPDEVAKDYIEELRHRSLLKVVVETKRFGGRKFIQVHDLVRELAISLSRKESSSVVNDVPQETGTVVGARRLSTQSCTDEIRLELPHLRTWIVSASSPSQSTYSSMFSNSKYLAVLELAGAGIERVPDDVGNLFNLHYLGLRRTKVKRLPESIGKLRRLQTMDLHATEIEILPSGIAKLRLLRHLFAEKIHAPSDRRPAIYRRSGVPVPAGLGDLKDLQTLKAVEASDLAGPLQKLTQLRSLRICRVRSIHCHRLGPSLSKLPFLSFLAISAIDEDETLTLKRWDSAPKHLQTLHLHGKLKRKTLEKGLFCDLSESLTILDLGWSGLTEDTLHFLSRFSNLIWLRLLAAYEGQSLCFRKDWFPNLKRLLLCDLPQPNQVKFVKGAMESLEHLRLDGIPKLADLPEGIEFLTSLQELCLKDLDERFEERFKESGNRRKTEHIRDACYVIEKGGEEIIVNLNDPLPLEDEYADLPYQKLVKDSMQALNALSGVDGLGYAKAVEKFRENQIMMQLFMEMPEERRIDWLKVLSKDDRCD